MILKRWTVDTHVGAHTYTNMCTQAKFLLKNWAWVLKPGLGPMERHKPHVCQIKPKVLMQSTHPMAFNYKTTKETLRWNIRKAKVVPLAVPGRQVTLGELILQARVLQPQEASPQSIGRATPLNTSSQKLHCEDNPQGHQSSL